MKKKKVITLLMADLMQLLLLLLLLMKWYFKLCALCHETVKKKEMRMQCQCTAQSRHTKMMMVMRRSKVGCDSAKTVRFW